MSNIIYPIFGMLIWSDLFNYIFEGTPLVAWKQIIVIIAWGYAVRIDMQAKQYFKSILAGVLTLTLIAWSLLACGVNFEIALFNSFLYFSWVPLFAVLNANSPLAEGSISKYQYYALALFVASVVGLYVDWYTDYFNWIEKQVSSVTLLESIGAARRASLFFISSTMVIPLIAAPGLLFYYARPTIYRAVLICIGLMLAVVPTGSGSSMVVAAICSTGLLAACGWINFMRSISVMGLAIVIAVTGASFSDDRTQLQVDRLLTAFDSETEANVGRIDFWQIAMNDISEMSGGELIFGTGLGGTNDNKGNVPKFSHGESSYFQAMIEAGFIGVLSRILPFIFILVFFVQSFLSRSIDEARGYLPIFFWGVASLFAVATAPTFGNIPFQAVVGFLLSILLSNFYPYLKKSN